MKEPSDNLTIMLNQWIDGDLSVENDLMNTIYPLLRDIAHQQLNKSQGSTFQTTVIINELYLKLKKQNRIQIQDKNHFLAITSQLIRNLIIDEFRSKNSQKRGQQFQQVTLYENEVDKYHQTNSVNIDWISLHNLLIELESIDPESVRLIELRFFAGLSIPETAEVMKTSQSSISRNWKFARSWLFNRLNNDE